MSQTKREELTKKNQIQNRNRPTGGTWVAQSVKRPTLDLGSGHDLTVHGFKPRVRLCAENAEPAWDSLSLPLSLPLTDSCCLCLFQK